MATSFKVSRIDEGTWAPVGDLAGVRSASVSKSDNRDGSTPAMESGSLEVEDGIEEGYYRIDRIESGQPVDPIATLLLAPDDDEFSHGQWTSTAIAQSVLAPAADKLFSKGDSAHKGQDGAAWVVAKLKESVKAPVVADGGFILDRHFVFDLNETHLDGCWRLLASAGWCMQIAATGLVRVMPIPSEPTLSYDSSLVMGGIGRSRPINDVPNVVRVYEGERFAEARNEDPLSPTSIPRRHGREIEYAEESPTLVDGETLEGYARRKLDEVSAIYETNEIERDWVSGALPYSCVRSYLPEAGTQCVCSVMNQDIKCENGVKVREMIGRRFYG